MHDLFAFLSEKQTCCLTLEGLACLEEREREGVRSRLQSATKHREVREGCLQTPFMFVHSENEDEEGWGDLNSKDLMIKGSFCFILGFFCSSELPSRLIPVPELWFFSLPRVVFLRGEKSGCGLPFCRATRV